MKPTLRAEKPELPDSLADAIENVWIAHVDVSGKYDFDDMMDNLELEIKKSLVQAQQEAVERFRNDFCNDYTKTTGAFELKRGYQDNPQDLVADVKDFLRQELTTIASKSAEMEQEQGLKDSLVLAYDLANKNGSLDYGKLHRKIEWAISQKESL